MPPDFAIAHRESLGRHGPIAVTLTRRSATGECAILNCAVARCSTPAGFLIYRHRREVTERARLSPTSERNEERIHASSPSSTDGYWEQDANLRYTAITASFRATWPTWPPRTPSATAAGFAWRIP